MSYSERKKVRWQRLNRMKKQRVNMYRLEQQVKAQGAQQELAKLDIEQTYALFEAVNQKICRLQDEVKQLRYALMLSLTQPPSVWQKVKAFFKKGGTECNE